MRRSTLLLLALCASQPALAQDARCPERSLYGTHIDCHFTEEDGRKALVDDRGGQGVAYGFGFDIDPEDTSPNDFCPHCSLAVFAADPGIDLSELELLGVSPDDVRTTLGLLQTLQQLAAEDPEQLVRDLRPNLEGPDLEVLIAEARRIVGRTQPLIEKLQSLQRIRDLEFDFDTTSLRALVEAAGLRMDSAFRADFDNPNDRRRNNSGVAVYTLPELVQAMVAGGVPEILRDQAESLLGNIPGLPGVFEMSGDDDDALAPVTFHGAETDLSIKARTYAVSGQNALLVEFTVVNDTRRVLPWVQLAVISDFDIPPQSRDLETVFDPSRFAVMVYDNDPLADPVKHAWFASAPVVAQVPGPGGWLPANWNLDKNLSLSQSARSVNDKRMQFFLLHPDVSGDHDDAIGKSEKQGAVSLVLAGPLLPGEQRKAAFCWAGAVGGSSAAARAETLATLDACRGLYALLTPVCGDGGRQLGEACDDGNTAAGDGCSADCEREICGDGKVVGAEACDDGNRTDDDGCSATCQVERCGDGIVQANEACDDANDVNTDGCLTSCEAARCGDGFVRGCDPAAEDCGCLGQSHCIEGTILFTSSRGVTPALDDLLDRSTTFRIGYGLVQTTSRPGELEVYTSQIEVEFEGDAPLPPDLAAALSGQQWGFTVRGGLGNARFEGRPLIGLTRSGTYSLNLQADRLRFPDGQINATRFEAEEVRMTLSLQPPRDPAISDIAAGQGPGRASVRQVDVGEEECDDGNPNSFDACTIGCTFARCGDGLVQLALGEACDVDEPWCDGACQLVAEELCGNGMVEEAQGEQCDDGNAFDDDGCSTLCREEVCGDGVRQVIEGCDDGNDQDGDGCTADCEVERCGDGVVQTPEACDEGEANADTGACLSSCLAATCGDGFVQAGREACDDGNRTEGDGCAPDCSVEICGDGAPGPDEECDDGNSIEGDGCTGGCVVEICGDGRPGPAETCDDGNTVEGDGCSKDCLLEDPVACGDARVGPGEECDDGNLEPTDGCDPSCRLEDPAACGDGVLNPGERCDDGNTLGGDGCSARCAEEGCGDHIQQPGERCDDGNTEPGDGCAADCTLEPTACGDGVQQVGERCDDGNDVAGDGCDACEVAPDPEALRATCGNGRLDPREQCDDGNRRDADGCDVLCQLEASVCGNGSVERGEACDPGPSEGPVGCGPDCQFASVCGNGALELGELCDDGNVEPSDGCDGLCRVEGGRPDDAGPTGDAGFGGDAGPTRDAGAADAGPIEDSGPADGGPCACEIGAECECGSGGGCGGCANANASPHPLAFALIALLAAARRRRRRGARLL